jgi:hypothetical protein
MKFSKIIAAVAAAALAFSAMTFSASAAEPLTFSLEAQNAGYAPDEAYTWVVVSQDVTIEGNGTYEVVFDVSANHSDIWTKFNTPAMDTAPAEYETAVIRLNSLKVNDVDWPVIAGNESEFYAPVQGEKVPYVNFNFWNTWYTEGNVIDTTNTEFITGTGYKFLDDTGAPILVESFTVNFTIDGVGGVTAAPASDGASTSASTGNMPIALIGGVAIVALTAAVVSRKRK